MKQKFPYHILDLVGSGQFGRVYLALNLQTKQLVALKELEKKRLSTKKFLRELYCLVMLPHPHVVPYKGVESYGNYRYLVLKYCEAGTLRNLINSSTKISVFQSLEIISQILSALQYAHNKEIIHRDIKPENILLSLNNSGWTAYISDFGIAELEQEIKQGIGFTGSPAYIAPETFYGKYSYSCDLYAVGILLFELVVGKLPFYGSPKELLTAHINQPVYVPETVPFIVRNIIFKALAKLPYLRFSNAETMRNAVKLAQEFLSVTQQNVSLFIKDRDQQVNVLKIANKNSLFENLNKIAIGKKQICLSKKNTIKYYSNTNNIILKKERETKIILNGIITDFSLFDKKCLVISQSINCFFFSYIFWKDLKQNHIYLNTNSLIADISYSEFLTISYFCSDSERVIFKILSLPNFQAIASWSSPPQIQYSNWNSLPKKLVTLDSGYGFAFYENSEKSKTSIQVFNRRGNWVANFSLATALYLITPNEAVRYCLLALDFYNPDIGLLINLKPFQITRIALPIAPSFIISQHKNFILCDRIGNIVVYNMENGAISQWQLPLEKASLVTAIAISDNSELLVATWSESQGILYRAGIQLN